MKYELNKLKTQNKSSKQQMLKNVKMREIFINNLFLSVSE